jgi:hypothetical protein
MGAGFGFAFGNFLQILGNVLEIDFNMWNVMEYSIGFFGGIAMAYGVFTSHWPEESLIPERWENKAAFLLLFVFIPLVVFTNSRFWEVIQNNSTIQKNPDDLTLFAAFASLTGIIAIAAFGWLRALKSQSSFSRKDTIFFFMLYFGAYIFISYCVTGAFSGIFHLNHHLYIVNYIVVMVLLGKKFPAFFDHSGLSIKGTRWLLYLAAVLVIIFVLAVILINIHGELNGSHTRFPNM